MSVGVGAMWEIPDDVCKWGGGAFCTYLTVAILIVAAGFAEIATGRKLREEM